MPAKKTASKPAPQQGSSILHVLTNPRVQAVLLALVAVLLYAQTLRFGYVLDDNLFITGNATVKRGLSAIPEIFTTHSMAGFAGSVNQGRYRPLTLTTFAIEQTLAPMNPLLGHAVNVALYAATAVVVYYLLVLVLPLLLQKKTPESLTPSSSTAFWITLLFLVHPTHTEVVANIKSRDILLGTLFMLGALVLYVRYFDARFFVAQKPDYKLLLGSAFCTACALLSQEGSLVLVPVLPLTVWFCTKSSPKAIGVSWLPVLVAAGVVLTVRQMVVAGQDERWAQMLVNNPYAGLSWWESFPTKTAILGRYLMSAFIWPLSLSYEYGYNQLPILSWGDWRFLLSFVIHLVLLGIALWRLPTRNIGSYIILAYLLSMSVASNYFLYYGMPMSDRMLYAGTIIGCSYIVMSWNRFVTMPMFFWFQNGWSLSLCYAIITFIRLPDWSSEYALFTHDVKNAPNCIRARVNAARVLLDSAEHLSNLPQNTSALQASMTAEAASHLRAALAIDSTALPVAYAMLAVTVSTPDSALRYLRRAATLDPSNIGCRVAALMGEAQVLLARIDADSSNINANADSVLALYRAALPLVPSLPEPRRSRDLERIYGTTGLIAMKRSDYATAERAFEQALRANPSNEAIRTNISIARFNAAFQLGVEYEQRGKRDSAIAWYERALATNVQNDVAAAELARLRRGR
jgi:tetratricopeptide (TPR) repeat protein